MLGFVTGFIEVTCLHFKFDKAKGYHEAMQLNMKNGFFDGELEQIAIEMKEWFARPPKQRLLGKSAFIFSSVVQQNSQDAAFAQVPQERRERARDL